MRKDQAHLLLDQLDPDQFDAISRLLEVMADPMACALAAAPEKHGGTLVTVPETRSEI